MESFQVGTVDGEDMGELAAGMRRLARFFQPQERALFQPVSQDESQASGRIGMCSPSIRATTEPTRSHFFNPLMNSIPMSGSSPPITITPVMISDSISKTGLVGAMVAVDVAAGNSDGGRISMVPSAK